MENKHEQLSVQIMHKKFSSQSRKRCVYDQYTCSKEQLTVVLDEVRQSRLDQVYTVLTTTCLPSSSSC